MNYYNLPRYIQLPWNQEQIVENQIHSRKWNGGWYLSYFGCVKHFLLETLFCRHCPLFSGTLNSSRHVDHRPWQLRERVLRAKLHQEPRGRWSHCRGEKFCQMHTLSIDQIQYTYIYIHMHIHIPLYLGLLAVIWQSNDIIWYPYFVHLAVRTVFPFSSIFGTCCFSASSRNYPQNKIRIQFWINSSKVLLGSLLPFPP